MQAVRFVALGLLGLSLTKCAGVERGTPTYRELSRRPSGKKPGKAEVKQQGANVKLKANLLCEFEVRKQPVYGAGTPDRSTSKTEVTREVQPCTTPYADAAVTARIGSEVFDLGKTDSEGLLEIDLSRTLPSDFVPPAKGRMDLLVDGIVVGGVDVAPVYQAREETMIAWMEAVPDRCRVPTSIDACDPLKKFMDAHPYGAYAAQARQIVNEAEPKLVVFQEQQAREALDLAACASPKGNRAAFEVYKACEPLQEYLTEYPTGLHASQVSAALKKGEALQRTLRAREHREMAAIMREREKAMAESAAAQAEYERMTPEQRALQEQRRAEGRLEYLFRQCEANRARIETQRVAAVKAARSGDREAANEAAQRIQAIEPGWNRTLSDLRDVISTLTGDQGPRFLRLIKEVDRRCNCHGSSTGYCGR